MRLIGVSLVVGDRTIFTGGDTCLYYSLRHIFQTVSDILQLIWREDVVIQGDMRCRNGAGSLHSNRNNCIVMNDFKIENKLHVRANLFI